MTRALALSGLLAATLLGCQDEPAPTTRSSDTPSTQTFDEAMRIVCSAPDQVEQPPESAGAANRAMVIAMWIDQRVHNQEVRKLMGGLAAQTPAGKLEALDAGARRAGIERCALAELWRAGR
jgi:hypothetical protein